MKSFLAVLSAIHGLMTHYTIAEVDPVLELRSNRLSAIAKRGDVPGPGECSISHVLIVFRNSMY